MILLINREYSRQNNDDLHILHNYLGSYRRKYNISFSILFSVLIFVCYTVYNKLHSLAVFLALAPKYLQSVHSNVTDMLE